MGHCISNEIDTFSICADYITGERLIIDVSPFETVSNLKERLETMIYSKNRVNILHKGRDLEDDSTLNTNGLKEGSILQIIPEIMGGGCIPFDIALIHI
jgi:molybdopterin converting factor small subunit